MPRIRLEREEEGRVRFLTEDEAARLLAACRETNVNGHRVGNADLADLVELSIFTGMRQGEALGLTWDRVDRARGVILLEGRRTKKDSGTKSRRRREVPLNARADAVLARRTEAKDGADLVFGSKNWDRYRSAWETAVKRAKLSEPLRWHDLRHTFASWAIQRRVSLYEIKELLGHSSLAMVKRYAHLAPEHLRSAAAALDDVFDSNVAATETLSESAVGAGAV